MCEKEIDEVMKQIDFSFNVEGIPLPEETKRRLPDNILAIGFTNSQKELAEIYSSADVFVNPTREENFPTTHLEALACGIPVITFNTGGAAESIDETCGIAIRKNDIDELEKILKESWWENIDKGACRKRAELFGAETAYQQYMLLMKKLME